MFLSEQNEKWTSDSKKSFYADDKGRALNYGYLSYYTCYITERVIAKCILPIVEKMLDNRLKPKAGSTRT